MLCQLNRETYSLIFLYDTEWSTSFSNDQGHCLCPKLWILCLTEKPKYTLYLETGQRAHTDMPWKQNSPIWLFLLLRFMTGESKPYPPATFQPLVMMATLVTPGKAWSGFSHFDPTAYSSWLFSTNSKGCWPETAGI